MCPSGNNLEERNHGQDRYDDRWSGISVYSTSHGGLESRCSTLGHGVPELGGAKVNVVDAEQIHVLNVPSEGCPPHAKVQIRCVDTRNEFRRLGKNP